MKKTITGMAFCLFLMNFIVPVYAASPEWRLDPAHSGIYFEIDHIYSATRGYFEKFTGKVIFDPNNLVESRFDFEVQVKSVNTGNTKRDGHLESEEFFNAGKYPIMTFKSSAIKHLGGKNYIVDGTMTVADVSQPVTVPFTFFGVKPHPFNKDEEVAGFESRMTIDRLEYNVGSGKYYEMGVVGKDVDVLISFEATRKK